MDTRNGSRPASNGASIQEIIGNIKRFLGNPETYIAGVLLLVSFLSFSLGRISVDSKTTGISTQNIAQTTEIVRTDEKEEVDNTTQPALIVEAVTDPEAIASVTTGTYVGSKNGKKYHLPWCAGAQQIKEENKIWFATKDEAEGAGYTPAANCKGI